MATGRKLKWLRRILAVKIALILLVWGLPALLAPSSLFRLLGVPTPDDLLFVRLFGAIVMAFGVAYWYAYKDPVHNAAIVKAGIADNGLVTLVIFVLTALDGLRSAFMWVSGLLTFILFVSFVLLMPSTEAA